MSFLRGEESADRGAGAGRGMQAGKKIHERKVSGMTQNGIL